MLRGGRADREVPFAQPGSLTKVYAIASGKGGVGKSTVTVNLALAMVKRGLKVGIVDADIYGHSIPDMLGVGDIRPTQVEDMIMPVPIKGLKVISIGMLKPRKDQVVAWRGPMLDRALVQMLSDVYWGDLDALLLDLPPGTGDMAISLGQHLPNAEIVVVTTPQPAAADVAERAGTMASMMHQRVVGVIENMSYLQLPGGERMEIFGSGGAAKVAETLSARFGYDVPMLGQIPLDQVLRAGWRLGSSPSSRPIRTRSRPRSCRASPTSSADARAGSPACSSGSRPPAGSRHQHVRHGRPGDRGDPGGRDAACSAPRSCPSSPSRPAASCAPCARWPTTPRTTSDGRSARTSPTSTSRISILARSCARTSSTTRRHHAGGHQGDAHPAAGREAPVRRRGDLIDASRRQAAPIQAVIRLSPSPTRSPIPLSLWWPRSGQLGQRLRDPVAAGVRDDREDGAVVVPGHDHRRPLRGPRPASRPSARA